MVFGARRPNCIEATMLFFRGFRRGMRSARRCRIRFGQVRNQCPQADERHARQIREQQRGQRRCAVDQLVKELVARFHKVGTQMEPERKHSGESLRQHHPRAQVEKAVRDG